MSEKRSNASKLTDAAKATAETGSELRKNQKQQSMHKRGHKEEKNGSKHLLRRLHSPQPSAIPVSQAAPFSAKKIKSLDLYRPIISASFYSQLRYEYAQAADRGRGIKTAQIGGTKKAAAPSAAAKPSMNQTSRVKPTQSAAGTTDLSQLYTLCVAIFIEINHFRVFFLLFFFFFCLMGFHLPVKGLIRVCLKLLVNALLNNNKVDENQPQETHKKNLSSSCDYNAFMFCFLGFDRNLVELFLGGSYEY